MAASETVLLGAMAASLATGLWAFARLPSQYSGSLFLVTPERMASAGWIAGSLGVLLMRLAPGLFAASPWTRGILAWGKLTPNSKNPCQVPKR